MRDVNRLYFTEAKRVGTLVGFDIAAYARKKKSCVQGSDWHVEYKRFFALTLLKHLEEILLESSVCLSAVVYTWYQEAKDAALEFALLEENLYPVLRQVKKRVKLVEK
jgi:hypothetical protein